MQRQLAALLLVIVAATVSSAQQGGTTRYEYDQNGRLRRVMLASGEIAIYQYDAAGNIIAITRDSVVPLTLSNFSPAMTCAGEQLEITGTGFIPNPMSNANTVLVNGIAATVTDASETVLHATVPEGNASGRITVSNTSGLVVSSADFTALPVPYTETDVAYLGDVTLGSSTVVTFPESTNDHQVALLRFSGAAAQSIGLWATLDQMDDPQTYVGLGVYGPDLATVPNATQDGRHAYSTPLPEAGVFLAAVDPNGSSWGTSTISIAAAPPDVTGALTSGTPLTLPSIEPGGRISLTFQATAGQKMYFKLDTEDEYFFTTYRPGGQFLSSVSLPLYADPIEPPGIHLPWYQSPYNNLPSTGTYTIVIEPVAYRATPVSATARLWLVSSDVTGAITPAEVNPPPVDTGTLTPGQMAIYSFDATAGDSIGVEVLARTPSAALVEVKRVVGGTIFFDAFVPAGSSFAAFTLPHTSTGTSSPYQIRVWSYWTQPTSATVRLYRSAPQSGTITIGGSPVNIAASVPAQESRLAFGITTPPSQRVRALVHNPSIAGTVRVIQFGDEVVSGSTWDFSAGSPGAPPSFFLSHNTSEAVFSLRTRFTSSPYTGTASVAIYDAVVVTSGLTTATPATIDLTSPGHEGLVTFTATTGQRVRLQTSSQLRIRVVLQGGQSVVQFVEPGTQVDLPEFGSSGSYSLSITSTAEPYVGSVVVSLIDAP